MGFTVPAVHYSALATQPPELTTSKSQHSISNTTNVRFKLNEIFKKLFNDDNHSKPTIPIGTDKQIQLLEITEKENDTSIVIKSPANNNSGHRTLIGQVSPRSPSSSIEPLERLPFTEPYFSSASKSEQIPFELSAYHKNCTRQEIKFNNKPSNSTTTLPELSSTEDRIGLKYASQRNAFNGIRSSYVQQQQTPHLRRLHSKSKIRPISNEPKPSISSSIAHRIELLKQSMHNHQLEVHQLKSNPTESSSSTLDTIHKQTQTTNTQLKSSEIHHIHHHHIYSSSLSSLPWRTYLSILGTIAIMFFLLIQFISIHF